jgi:hypothetical protein
MIGVNRTGIFSVSKTLVSWESLWLRYYRFPLLRHTPHGIPEHNIKHSLKPNFHNMDYPNPIRRRRGRMEEPQGINSSLLQRLRASPLTLCPNTSFQHTHYLIISMISMVWNKFFLWCNRTTNHLRYLRSWYRVFRAGLGHDGIHHCLV